MVLPISYSLRAGMAAGLIASAGAAIAADTAPQPEDNRWHGNVSVGGAFASGNTTSTTVSATADGAKATAQDKISLSGLINYGRTSTTNDDATTTANQAWLRGRYDYNLSELMFAFGGAEAETNKVAGLDSRYGLNAGLGYKLIRQPNLSWNLFAGVGYSGVEYTDNTSANGAELLFGEESEHKFTEATTFKQRFVFRPGQGDLGNFATFNAVLATTIIDNWTLNLGLNVQYASAVPVGNETTDSLLTVGFGYKF